MAPEEPESAVAHDFDGVMDLKGHAVLDDPIVGHEVTISDDHGPGALAVRPLPSPHPPTPQAMARHFLTHVPYAPWCPFCVAFRKPNNQHRRGKRGERVIPLMVADHAFVRNSEDVVRLKLLIARCYPSRTWFACVVDRKGVDDLLIERFADFITDTGFVNFAYRADREPALLAFFDEAVRLAGRSGRRLEKGDPLPDDVAEDMSIYDDLYCPEIFKDASSSEPTNGNAAGSTAGPIPCDENDVDKEAQIKEAVKFYRSGKPVPVAPVTAAPEHSFPGESKSNGKAERSIRSFVELFACLNGSLEARLQLQQPLPCTHPVIKWLVEHTSFILNTYQLDAEGRTPYGHLHGKEIRDRLAEVGEVVLWYVPMKARAKLECKWRYGVFLGRSLHTDANYVGLNDGSVVMARALTRVIPSDRWSITRIHKISGIPGAHRAHFDALESEPEPHSFASSETPPEDMQGARRRLKITLNDLGRYGFSRNCTKCRCHSQNRHALGHKMHHTETCRARIDRAMQAVEGPKILGSDAQKVSSDNKPASADTNPDTSASPPHTPTLAEGQPPGADPEDPDLMHDEPPARGGEAPSDSRPDPLPERDAAPSPPSSPPQPHSAEEGRTWRAPLSCTANTLDIILIP